MASLKDIKRRITAVKNTQKVTRAMKLVAAARLRRAQQAAFDSRLPHEAIYKSAMRVSRHLGSSAPTLWRKEPDVKTLDLFVITSDRGLCGGFNENLLKLVVTHVSRLRQFEIDTNMFVLGKKGISYLAIRGHEFTPVAMSDADKLADIFIKRLQNGESQGADVIYNRFVNPVKQEPKFENILPLYSRGDSSQKALEYIYEEDRSSVLNSLCRETVLVNLRHAMLESTAAEFAARMSAMDNATKNADEMIDYLTFLYNRVRQDEITLELMDIVGGAEALR